MGKVNYGLDLDFLDSIEDRFAVNTLVSGYKSFLKDKSSDTQETGAKMFFSDFGKKLAATICSEEAEHRDRMAETIYEIAEKTGHIFPSVPQRLFEISMIALRPEDKWNYREISQNAIVYEVTKCAIYDKLMADTGEDNVKKMPCWNFCRTLCDEIYSKTGVRVKVSMEKSIADDHRCIVRAENYS